MKNNLITILLIIFIFFTFAGIERNYICIDKETPDWTGTTQGNAHEDSVDGYMRHWYEVLDTNSNGDIDDTE